MIYARLIFALLLAVASISSNALNAQEPPRAWYFGYNASIGFTPSGPTRIGEGQSRSFEGGAVGAHPLTGEVLFYTGGSILYNVDDRIVHSVMENGSDLRGHYSSAQSALIVPW